MTINPLSYVGLYILAMIITAMLPIGDGFKRLIIIIEFVMMLKGLVNSTKRR